MHLGLPIGRMLQQRGTNLSDAIHTKTKGELDVHAIVPRHAETVSKPTFVQPTRSSLRRLADP